MKRINLAIVIMALGACILLVTAVITGVRGTKATVTVPATQFAINRAYVPIQMSTTVWHCSDSAVSQANGTILSATWQGAHLTLAYADADQQSLPITAVSTSIRYDGSAGAYAGTFSNASPYFGVGQVINYVCLARFPGLPRPVGVVVNNAQGAGCCYEVQVIEPMGDSAIRVITQESPFSDDNFSMYHFGDRVLFLGPDLSFQPTDFVAGDAQSYPLKIIELRNSRFVDVTAQFPAFVFADAEYQWSVPHHQYFDSGDTQDFYASWMYDECNLGHGFPAAAWNDLSYKMAHGQLVAPTSTTTGNEWGSGFLATLRTVLQQHGLCTNHSLPVS